jgi:ribonucleoside-triphosphate reductase
MIMITKRDGRVVEFEKERVQQAIIKAMQSVKIETEASKKTAEQIASNVQAQIAKDARNITVEKIQDLVEKELMVSNYPSVAKAYILYRDTRNKVRNSKSDQIINDIVCAKKNDVTRENANMNADTPAGMMMKIASERSKEFGFNYLLSKEAAEAVEDNILHVHDFDYYPTKSLTCLQHPINKILSGGFQAGHGESRPAKRIETASILGCISMETVQNEMHGGQAIPAFDFYMAPYVRSTFVEELKKIEALQGIDLSSYYDAKVDDFITLELEGAGEQRMVQHAINETVKRVHQAMEAFIHNLNTIHSRGGNQVVFSSINYGTDTSAEGRCIIRELLKTTQRGVGNGSTAIFPIQIWKKKRGVNFLPGDPNYDLYSLACEVTAKRFFPNFINLDATFNQHEKWRADDPERYIYEAATMGCRTRVFENVNGEKTSVGRGNLSFSTINLPGLAMSCMDINDQEERIAEFYKKLDEALDIMARQLYDRYKFQCTAEAKQFPLLMSGLWVNSENLKPTDSVESVLNQGTLGLGFIGLAECLIALTGHHHGQDEDSQKLGLAIVTRMKNKAAVLTSHYKLNFSVLATPAEGLSGKFTKRDKLKYGIIRGITDKDYYTNSNHVPVAYKCSAAHKAEVEGPYHELTRGGHIFYVELDGDATHNVEAIMDIVTLMDKYNIGYGSVNHNRNRCLDCGYEDATKNLKVCPKCGSENIDRLQRITGYLVGTTDRWNSGKIAELNDRVTHD